MSAAAAEAAAFVRRRWPVRPRWGLILGTGVREVAGEVEVAERIACGEIPHLPRSTALGHAGTLVCGRLRGRPMVAMEGRCHLYEGYSLDQVTLPVRMLASLGAASLVMVSAVGGLHRQLAAGDLVAIADHLNLMGRRTAALDAPISGPPILGRSGRLYDAGLIDRLEQVARQQNIPLVRGVYAAVTGPNYETRAEYRALRRMGADVVGMSTVPEAMAAVHRGMRVVALAVVTNVALPDALHETHAERVVKVASEAVPRIRALITALAEEDVF